MFYNLDKKHSLKASPRVTDCDINRTAFEKIEGKLVTHIFIASVSAGMNLYIRTEAVTTSKFLEKLDKIFDDLNSSKLQQYNKLWHLKVRFSNKLLYFIFFSIYRYEVKIM